MDSIPDATQEDQDLYSDVAFAFYKFMCDDLVMKEGTAKSYVRNLAILFAEDQKSLAGMATEKYFVLTKASPENRRGNGQRSATVRKLMDFWTAKGADLWTKKDFKKAPPDRMFEKTIRPRRTSTPAEVAPAKTAPAARPSPTKAAPKVPAEAAATPPKNTSAPAAASAPSAGPVEKAGEAVAPDPPASNPAPPATLASPAQQAAPANATSTASSAPAPKAPVTVAAEPAVTPLAADVGGAAATPKPGVDVKDIDKLEASPEDQNEIKDLLPRFKDFILTKGKGDEYAKDLSKKFGDLLKKVNKPLAVMGTEAFFRWLNGQGRNRPGTAMITSAKWFGYFWVEKLGRTLEGNLCQIPEFAKPGDDLNHNFMDNLLNKRRHEFSSKADREADKRRKMEELAEFLQQDPPDVESDTEYQDRDVNMFPKSMTVEGSGKHAVDGNYVRYKKCSRGRPCYQRHNDELDKKNYFLYWNRHWRISPNFGHKDSICTLQDMSTDSVIVAPCEPYPQQWKVMLADKQNGGEKKTTWPLLMRVFDMDAIVDDGDFVTAGFGIKPFQGRHHHTPKRSRDETSEGTTAKISRSEARSPQKAKAAKAGSPSEIAKKDDDSSSNEEKASSSSSEEESEDSSSSDSGDEETAAGNAGASQSTNGGLRQMTRAQLKQRLIEQLSNSRRQNGEGGLQSAYKLLMNYCKDDESWTHPKNQISKMADLSKLEFQELVEECLEEMRRTTPRPPAGPPPGRSGAVPSSAAHDQRHAAVGDTAQPFTPPDIGGDSEDETARYRARFAPPNHRTALPARSALKPKGLRVQRGRIQMHPYGQEVTESADIVNYRGTEDLWVYQPGMRVICDRCGDVFHQSLGLMAGAMGRPQFAQNEFWCNQCGRNA